MMMVFGVLLMMGLVMMLSRGAGWPFFIFFFWGGPWLFGALRRSMGYDDAYDEVEKRKNDDFEKARNDDWTREPVEYITTDDGEVMEVIEDRPARRTSDWI